MSMQNGADEHFPLEGVMRRIAAGVLRFRIALLMTLVLATIFFGRGLGRFRIADTLSGQLPKDDPEILYIEESFERFGHNEILAVGLELGDVFTAENLELISRLTDRIEKVPNVTEVLSLANAVDMRGTDEGVDFRRLYDTPPVSLAEMEALRRRVLSNPYWIGNVISRDGRAASVNAFLPYKREGAMAFRLQVVDDVKAIIDEEVPVGMTAHLAGLATLGSESRDSILGDLKTYMWALPIFSCAILYILFHGLRGIVIPQSVIFMTIVWSMGLFFLRGRALSWSTTILPVLIGVICTSDVIHILSRYYEEARRWGKKDKALVEALAHMIRPCFLTSTTTMIGFASLLASRLIPVREFGLYAAVGLAFAYIIGITLTPISLSFLSLPRSLTGVESGGPGLLSRGLARLSRFIATDRLKVPLLTALILGVAAVGIFRIEVETQLSMFLPKESKGLAAYRFFDDRFCGIGQIEIELKGTEGTFSEPRALEEIDRIQRAIETFPGTLKGFSVVSFIKDFHKAMNAEEDRFYAIPQDRRTLAEYFLLFEVAGREDLLDAFVTYDRGIARISIWIEGMSSADQLELIERVDGLLGEELDPGLSYRLTGGVVIFATLVQALVQSQVNSLFVAFLVITAMMCVHFRSLKVGLVSMIPNMMPIAITLGIMGWMGITLNPATVMIACISLGIAVDDTIHYLSRYHAEYGLDHDRPAATDRTMMSTGRAIVFTSVVIIGGFWLLVFSDFEPNAHFGILTGVTMISALLADLVVAPYCIKLFRLGD